jgi:hypothetical protein
VGSERDVVRPSDEQLIGTIAQARALAEEALALLARKVRPQAEPDEVDEVLPGLA